MKTVSNSRLNEHVEQPHYQRKLLKSRIVHIGFGAFHRAHQALMTHRLLEQYPEQDWGICEVALHSDSLITSLRKQDHLYTVLEKGESGQKRTSVVGAVTESLAASLDGIQAIVEKMAEPQVAIVSLTITEKGYCTLPGSQQLDFNNPSIAHDIATPQQPQSAPGLIVEALNRRWLRGLPPFTVLSCDNMLHNGAVVKQAILQLAQQRSAKLARWIEQQVTFPSTMVDRIVPALNAESAAEITAELGVEDPCGIVCESFIQWVIEDNFVAGRPAWEQIGAELVNDVLPYEQMKLRMLNGSHSFLAYLGYLAGYQYIHECMADYHFLAATRHLMLNEQAPTLIIKGVDLAAYAQRLLIRFTSTALKHRTEQIAMDGSQKVPQRILPSIQWHIAQQSDYSALALTVAGWMRYVSGVDEFNNSIKVRDPMAEQLIQICQNSPDGDERVDALLAIDSIFPPALASHDEFKNKLKASYHSLISYGARATVARLAACRCHINMEH